MYMAVRECDIKFGEVPEIFLIAWSNLYALCDISIHILSAKLKTYTYALEVHFADRKISF